MKRLEFRKLLPAFAALFLAVGGARAASFAVTPLASSTGSAPNTDSNLKDPWGLASSATSPFFVANLGTLKATTYNSAGVPQSTIISVPGGPTGVVANTTSDFVIFGMGPSTFIFPTLAGGIAAWNPSAGSTTILEASTPGAVYTGLALGNNGSANFLYAADPFNNHIDVFNSIFPAASLPGSFTDPTLPAGFTPFNIQNLGGRLYVTYTNGSTGGIVDAFDLNGNLLQRIAGNSNGGTLNNPWGLALAPSSFGAFAGDLLVANHGDGMINIYNPTTGTFLGRLTDAANNPLVIPGLRGLLVGNDTTAGLSAYLYYTADGSLSVTGEFGVITPVPLPAALPSATLLLVSLATVNYLKLRRSSPASLS